jgi:hypothetical protein
LTVPQYREGRRHGNLNRTRRAMRVVEHISRPKCPEMAIEIGKIGKKRSQ